MKKLYLVVSSELANKLPAEIIRGFTSEKKAAELFKSITGASDDTTRRVVNDEDWVTNYRLLDDECFYTIIQTELEE